MNRLPRHRLDSLGSWAGSEGRVTYGRELGTPGPVAFRFVDVVPEPSSGLLAALGLLGLLLSSRRVTK